MNSMGKNLLCFVLNTYILMGLPLHFSVSAPRAPPQSCCPIIMQGLFLYEEYTTVSFFHHGTSQHSCQIIPTLLMGPSEGQLLLQTFWCHSFGVLCKLYKSALYCLLWGTDKVRQESAAFHLLGASWQSMNH